jgi:plasmid stabilization system protein ParE
VVYRLRPAQEIGRDLELIENHLLQAYQGFGEEVDVASARASARIKEALDYIESFVGHPHRGTEQPKIRSGLRTVTSNRFIYYFEIDEFVLEVRILAVFFGGVDHQRQILERLRH